MTVFGDGSQTRSFCYCDDLIRGLVLLAESNEHVPVNLGNPNEMTLLALAELVIRVTGSESEIIFEALPIDDPNVRKPDITRASQVLGWERSSTTCTCGWLVDDLGGGGWAVSAGTPRTSSTSSAARGPTTTCSPRLRESSRLRHPRQPVRRRRRRLRRVPSVPRRVLRPRNVRRGVPLPALTRRPARASSAACSGAGGYALVSVPLVWEYDRTVRGASFHKVSRSRASSPTGRT